MSSTTPSLEALYEHHRDVVFRRCLKLLGSRALAEEATHDVFLKTAPHAARLESVEAARGYLLQAASHHCLNLLRTEGRLDSLAPDGDVPAGPVSGRAAARDFTRRLVAQLGTFSRGLLLDVLLGGEDKQDYAQRRGVARKTVTRRLQRLMQRARKLLDGDEP